MKVDIAFPFLTIKFQSIWREFSPKAIGVVVEGHGSLIVAKVVVRFSKGVVKDLHYTGIGLPGMRQHLLHVFDQFLICATHVGDLSEKSKEFNCGRIALQAVAQQLFCNLKASAQDLGLRSDSDKSGMVSRELDR